MSGGKRPAYNIRIQFKDKSEQSFTTFSGKEVTSRFRNVGAAWPGQYEETPYNLTFDEGTKLVTPDGMEYDLAACYMDLRELYDADKAKGGDKKPSAKSAPKRAPVKDPFAD